MQFNPVRGQSTWKKKKKKKKKPALSKMRIKTAFSRRLSNLARVVKVNFEFSSDISIMLFGNSCQGINHDTTGDF